MLLFRVCFVLYFMKLSTGKVFLNQILGPKFLRKFSNYDRGQKSKKPMSSTVLQRNS